MQDFATGLTPLEGGFSGETFVAAAGEERSVVRIYAGRSVGRGPQAPEVDAAVLALVAPVIAVPRVLEVRAGDDHAGLPGLLVCSLEPGERLDLLLPDLGPAESARVGHGLGTVLGRLGLALQPRRGSFVDRDLTVSHDGLPDLAAWAAQHRARLPADLAAGLDEAVGRAEDLLVEDTRSVLVHGDLNPRNVLVDPVTLEVTAILDWELAHAGGPWTDLGNLLRHVSEPIAGAALEAYAGLVPHVPPDVRSRARAADLAAVVELAARAEDSAPVRLARRALAGWTSASTGA